MNEHQVAAERASWAMLQLIIMTSDLYPLLFNGVNFLALSQ